MTKKIYERAMGIARGTALTIGVAVMMALVLGVATSALAGTGVGARFDLGKTNTVNAVSKLVGSVVGPSLQLDNNSTGAGATALDLQVEPGKAPMKVNSGTKVTNLNSDTVDGKDSSQFQQAGAPVPQALTLTGGWSLYGNGFGTPAFYKDAEGIVHLEGTIECTTPDAGCGIVAFLPQGFRPDHEFVFPITALGPSLGTLSVHPDGKITVSDSSPGNSNVEVFASLEGADFRAVQQ
jgi:hypothetical protein